MVGHNAIADLFEGVHRTMRVVRRDLSFSRICNVIFAALTVAPHISPFVAAVIMPSSGLTGVASSVMSGRGPNRDRART